MRSRAFLTAAAAAIVLAGSGPVLARGYDFRNFDGNHPRVGGKAPLPGGYDEEGAKLEMSSFLDGSHLVVVFGALT